MLPAPPGAPRAGQDGVAAATAPARPARRRAAPIVERLMGLQSSKSSRPRERLAWQETEPVGGMTRRHCQSQSRAMGREVHEGVRQNRCPDASIACGRSRRLCASNSHIARDIAPDVEVLAVAFEELVAQPLPAIHAAPKTCSGHAGHCRRPRMTSRPESRPGGSGPRLAARAPVTRWSRLPPPTPTRRENPIGRLPGRGDQRQRPSREHREVLGVAKEVGLGHGQCLGQRAPFRRAGRAARSARVSSGDCCARRRVVSTCATIRDRPPAASRMIVSSARNSWTWCRSPRPFDAVRLAAVVSMMRAGARTACSARSGRQSTPRLRHEARQQRREPRMRRGKSRERDHLIDGERHDTAAGPAGDEPQPRAGVAAEQDAEIHHRRSFRDDGMQRTKAAVSTTGITGSGRIVSTIQPTGSAHMIPPAGMRSAANPRRCSRRNSSIVAVCSRRSPARARGR